MDIMQRVWKKGMTKLKQWRKILLALVKPELKSLINEGNCTLVIYLFWCFWLFLVSKRNMGEVLHQWIYACEACSIIKTKTCSNLIAQLGLGLIMLHVSLA